MDIDGISTSASSATSVPSSLPPPLGKNGRGGFRGRGGFSGRGGRGGYAKHNNFSNYAENDTGLKLGKKATDKLINKLLDGTAYQ